MYENAEIFSQKNSIISNVIGDIIENTINGQKTQIDPSPNWFMNTMSGLEELLLEAEEGMDESSRDIMQITDLIESDGYICGECGKNCNLLEDMKDHLNKSHGLQISLQDTPSVISVKPGKKALNKKVELLVEAMKKLRDSRKMLTEDKQQGPTRHRPMAHPVVFRYLSYSTRLAQHAVHRLPAFGRAGTCLFSSVQLDGYLPSNRVAT